MREITKELRDKFQEELEEVYLSGYLEIKDKIRIPAKIVSKIERITRVFELQNIEDIINHYPILSSYRYIPISALYHLIKTLPHGINSTETLENRTFKIKETTTFKEFKDLVKEEFIELRKGFDEFLNLQDLIWMDKYRWNIRVNLNIGVIDNIYIDNFSFSRGRFYEACKFDIMDKTKKIIKGIIVSVERENEDYKEQLTKILSSSPITAFDLQFLALTDKYKIKRNGVYAPRDRILSVLDVHEHKDHNEYVEQTDIPTEVTLPKILKLI